MADLVIQAKHAALEFEEEATFSIDPEGTKTLINYIRNAKLTKSLEVIELDTQQAEGDVGTEPGVIGPKGGQLTFDVPISSRDDAESPIMSLIKRMGCEELSIADKATQVIDGDTDEIHVADANNAGLAVNALVYHIPASGTPSIRQILRVQTGQGVGEDETHCTIVGTFATTPDSGDSISAMDTVISKVGEPDKTFSCYMYIGEGSDARKYALTGCSGIWTVGQDNNIPVIHVTMDVDSWVDSEAGKTHVDPVVDAPKTVLGGKAYWGGTQTATKDIGLDPGLVIEPIASFGDNGRQGYVFSDGQPMVTFAPLDQTAFIAALEAGTLNSFIWERIVDSSHAWAFSCPQVQVTEHNEEADGAIMRPAMSLMVRRYGLNDDDARVAPWAFGIAR